MSWVREQATANLNVSYAWCHEKWANSKPLQKFPDRRPLRPKASHESLTQHQGAWGQYYTLRYHGREEIHYHENGRIEIVPEAWANSGTAHFIKCYLPKGWNCRVWNGGFIVSFGDLRYNVMRAQKDNAPLVIHDGKYISGGQPQTQYMLNRDMARIVRQRKDLKEMCALATALNRLGKDLRTEHYDDFCLDLNWLRMYLTEERVREESQSHIVTFIRNVGKKEFLNKVYAIVGAIQQITRPVGEWEPISPYDRVMNDYKRQTVVAR